MTGVKEWLKRNKLSLNVEKTEFILLGTRSKLRNIHDDKITVTINGTPLKRVHTCKHLGVIVDENITWRNHIDHVRRKALAGVHVIKKVKNIFPQTTIKLLYNAIVSSHFEYCDVVWGNCGATLQTKLQKLQNKSARMITNAHWSVPSSVNLDELKWAPLEEKRRKHDAIMMFKIVNNLAPMYLKNKFKYTNTGYDLRRSSLSLSTPMPKTDSLKRSFCYRGAMTWNSLNHDIQTANSVNRFKCKLKARNV